VSAVGRLGWIVIGSIAVTGVAVGVGLALRGNNG